MKYIKLKLFIFPSRVEGMSNMLLEVLSLKNVIASNIPANTTIFNDNEIIFFNNEDHDDLARKIKFALNNELYCKNLTNKNYKNLKINFT